MSKTKEALASQLGGLTPNVETVMGGARSPMTIAVMGRAVLVELTHGFDLLVLLLESGPIAHVCQRGRVIARIPMAQC